MAASWSGAADGFALKRTMCSIMRAKLSFSMSACWFAEQRGHARAFRVALSGLSPTLERCSPPRAAWMTPHCASLAPNRSRNGHQGAAMTPL